MDQLLHLFEQYPHLAIIISIAASIFIAIAGVIPSVFITAANIMFFGFLQGTLISFAGEAAGALIAFILYRNGFKKTLTKRMDKYPRLQKLVNTGGKEAFYLIFSLRLVPFVPSGVITFAAAMGKVSGWLFFIASSLGKIPALLIESYSVYKVAEFGWEGKLILAFVGLGLVLFIIKKRSI